MVQPLLCPKRNRPLCGFIGMYSETIDALAQQAAAKLEGQRRSLLAHLIRSMLAGMYVGAAIVLIFIIGGGLFQNNPPNLKLLVGVCFWGAPALLVFARPEI